jgi:hypothetical protein
VTKKEIRAIQRRRSARDVPRLCATIEHLLAIVTRSLAECGHDEDCPALAGSRCGCWLSEARRALRSV